VAPTLTTFADARQFLRQVSAFSPLEDGDLERLADQFHPVHAGIGQVICRAGEVADCFYLIYSGRVRVVSEMPEGEITVGTLSRGDHVGEQGLLSGGTRAFTVRAAEDIVLLRLGREEFERILASRPALRELFERHLEDLGTRNFVRLCSTFRVLRPREVQ